jgi:DNA integrity scanning protein DisA with diadenylate cyclase activity/CRP-like cAMP-binding protein
MMRDAREERGLTPEQVEALMPYGREFGLQTGDLLFDERSVVDSFYVVLEGEIEISRLDGAEEIPVLNHGPGEFTGGLVMLTGRTSIHRAKAAEPSRILEIDSETFRRLPVEVPDVADMFISGLARRMRYTQRAYRQQEKFAALGKLSAGLTHELNNPAAAARRASEELGEAILEAQLTAIGHDERFSAGEREVLVALQRETAAGSSILLDPLSLGDAEDELADWLGDCGCEEPWDLAPALAEAGVGMDRLEEMAEVFDDRSLACGLEWLAGTLDLVGLAGEIETCAGRISELVGAMKEYTYMDRAVVGEVDVISGLQNTLTILGPRLKGISLSTEYEKDLPNIPGRGSELNQVWTNVIDNAIDAVEGRGSSRGRRRWVRDTTRGAGPRLRAFLHDQRCRGRDRTRAGYRVAHRHRSWRRDLTPVRAWGDTLHGKVTFRYETERRLIPMGKTQLFEEICSEKRQVNKRVLEQTVSLAVEIAREGREGRKIGTLFVVGDSGEVTKRSKPMILDPLHGHPDESKQIENPDMRETIKELAQLDGAFLVSNAGVVLSAARYIDAASDSLDLPLGLGSRHMAGASISLQTRAVAVVVSESSMVRMFDDGELVSEIVPELWMIDGYRSRMEGRTFTRRDEDLAVIGRAD